MIARRYKELLGLVRLSPFDTSTPEGRDKERYRRIVLNTLMSVLARLSMALTSLAVIPILLGYLDKTAFGVWSTITSTATWFTLFELGIVNSLVNALSEAYGKDDQELARKYISTAFLLLILISTLASLAASILAPYIDWERLFGVSSTVKIANIRLVVLCASLPIIIGMPFSVVRQIYAGYQKTYKGNIFGIVGSLLSLFAVYISVRMALKIQIITGLLIGIPVLVTGLNAVYLFKFEMPWLQPKLSSFALNSLKRLMSTSVPLFLFQVGALLVNQTQPIVLAHRSGPEEVTEYTVVIRIFQAFMSLIVMSTIAFVPSFREAYERGDHTWIESSFKRMLRIRMLLAVIFSIAISISGNFLVRKWLGRTDIEFPLGLWIALSVLMLVSTWSTAYSDLLVIMDRIWIQVALVTINGISILILTYLLVPSIGVTGAVIAITGFTGSILSWLLPKISKPVLIQNTEIQKPKI